MEQNLFDTFDFTVVARLNATLHDPYIAYVRGAESGVFSYKMSQLTGNHSGIRSVSKEK